MTKLLSIFPGVLKTKVLMNTNRTINPNMWPVTTFANIWFGYTDRFERESWTGDARACVLHSCRVSDRPVPPYTHWNAHRDSLNYMLDMLCLNDCVHVQFHYGKDVFNTCTEKYKPTPKNGAHTATNQSRSARYEGSKKNIKLEQNQSKQKKSHLDLQLWGGSSFSKDTAPFSINIWKRHRPSQLFLPGHFELNHRH